MQVTLDEDISDFNETAYRIELAALYGVPLEYIVLSATPASLVLHISIKPPPGQLPPSDNLTATSILDRVASITPSDLSSALGPGPDLVLGAFMEEAHKGQRSKE